MILCNLRFAVGKFAMFVLILGMIFFHNNTSGNALGLLAHATETKDSLNRSAIDLQPVLVTGGRSIQLHSEIGKAAQIGSDIMTQNAARNLADVLAENSLLYIKSLGQGAQATSSFRGTSSSHTQVLWNGININSTTLGNFDFSLIPSFFVDELNIYSGVAQMRGGSSIGGSVQLNNKWIPLPADGNQVSFRGEWGSWATQTYGLSWKWKKKRWSSNTRVYLQDSKNNFRYENRVLTMNAFEETRKQSAYSQIGLLQEFYYRLNSSDVLSFCFWGQWDQRELPQPITSFNTVDESQKTYNLRSLVKYSMERGRWKSIVSLAYLRDQLEYWKRFPTGYGDISSLNHSDAWMLAWDNSFKFNPKWEARWSAQYRMDQINSASYAQSLAKRTDLQLQGNLSWYPNYRWHFDVSATAESMKSTRKNLQTVPNLSAVVQYQLVEDVLNLRYSQSLNHRFPTLNDWYWEPGGNPDLLPEKASTKEFGIQIFPYWNQFSPRINGLRWKTELSVYQMEVKDWIMWVPVGSGYVWEPRNFARVQAIGGEWMSQLRYTSKTLEQGLSFYYAYSASVDRTREGTANYGRQLPYIPLNKWNVRYSVERNFENRWIKSTGLTRWNAAYSTCFTDVRYTSADQSYYTPSYYLHDLLVGTEWKRSVNRTPYVLKFQLRINNLWNAYYESTQYYPMPHRNFSFSLSLLCG